MPERIHTVQETAHILRCSARLVRGLIASGELNAIRIGSGTERKRHIVPESSLEAFITAKKESGRPS